MRRPSQWTSGTAARLLAAAASAAWLPADSRGQTGPAPASHAEEFRAIADRLYRGDNPFLGNAQVAALEQRLAGSAAPVERAAILRQLSFEHLRLGNVRRAIEAIDEAVQLAQGPAADERLGRTLPDLLYDRGIAHLRDAEVENCIRRHNAECCIFPLRGGGLHTDDGPARRAREDFERVLALQPDNLRAVWLLNIAAMALGEHPAGVPERWLIEPSALESPAGLERFIDIAPGLGLDLFDLCGGCIADDFDGDGLLDVFTTSYDPAASASLFLNRGAGGFENASAASRVNDQFGGLNCVGADYDNDGDLDVYILRGAWLFDDGRLRNSLLRNDGGVFVDVTREAGLAEPAQPTQSAVWADFDNDSRLDLYVGAESRLEMEPGRRGDYPGQLYRNNGDGTFTDIAPEAGVMNDRYCKGVAAGDYDDDGDMDLYVSNIGPNRLYRNNGDGTFTDIAGPAGVSAPEGRSFATWFFDYDNDGRLDIFVAGYDAVIEAVAADLLGRPVESTSPCLYRNNGDGTFTDVAASVGLDHAFLPMGANFGDIDGDGWLDIYLATGDPAYETLMPNVMLRNEGGRRFQNVTIATGLGHLQKGHGVAFADFDHDGDQDIYHQLGGFFPGDKFRNAFFLNPNGGARFLVVEFEGGESNRAGVGVRFSVTVSAPGGERTVHRAVGSVSSFGGSPRRQEVGLGADATAIERIEVWWPASGVRSVYEGAPLDSRVLIKEGAERIEPLPFPRLDLGPAVDPAGR